MAFAPGYSTYDGWMGISSARLGLDGRYYFSDRIGAQVKPWLGLGGGVVYYDLNWRKFRNRVSAVGGSGRIALGATPWGKNKSFGPIITSRYDDFSYAWEGGNRRSVPHYFSLMSFCMTVGLEWQLR